MSRSGTLDAHAEPCGGLVAAHIHGDQVKQASTAQQLFLRHERDVNRLVFHLLGPDRDHDDVVQDVFIRIVTRYESLRDPSMERAWVARITVNTVRNLLRRRKVRRLVELWPSPPEKIDPGEDQMEARDLVQRGWQLLDRLPANQRMALVLRKVQERPLSEIADICRCSVATVKRRVTAAEKQLQTLLSQDPELYQLLGQEAGQ